MFDNDLTLNANPFTGVSAAKVHALTGVDGSRSTRSARDLALTTPQVLDIQHTETVKNGARYIRSTIGLTRSEIPPSVSSTESAKSFQHSVRLVLERPRDTTVVSQAEIATQIGELLSVFGVSLSVAGVPTAALAKFLNREP